MDNITFDNMPAAVSLLMTEIVEIKTMLRESGRDPDKWMDIDQLCAYLPGEPKKKTIYSKIDQIPHSYNGKRLIFQKSQIDEWLSEGGWS